MRPDTVIKGGQIVTPQGVIMGDLGIRGGKIISVGPEFSAADKVVDATDKVVLPGGIDPHAHIEQMSGMGQWNADTFETATKSAAMGGTTSVISFAAQNKGQSIKQTVADYAARAGRGAMIDYAFHITVTDPAVKDFGQDIRRFAAEGHRSLKVFTTYNIQLDDAALLGVMRLAREAGALVCVHAENDAIIADARDRLIEAGQITPADHARSRPRVAEIEAIERVCRFAEHLDQSVMIFHVSAAESVTAIRAAQARGAPVRAETCPHYLFMTADVLDRPGLEGAKWMCSPPQRTKTDQDALRDGLADGTLSLVSSDHAPYRFDETGKLSAGPDAGFHQIANGLPGLETRLPLMFDAMVSQGDAGLSAFAELTATAPARLYGLAGKGSIAPGMDADIAIWDPDRKVTWGDDDLHDNVGYNPWSGRSITGWPVQVFLRGDLLVDDGTFLGSPGTGRRIQRPEPVTFTSTPEVRA
ncbi:dihydropyrimidinase [uncultured Roseobacter sp.]|uniref:dihydropyrimidinase n=1 Tax=uncultured Roseobacter sp. TaxID=114847 RepID=UPI0026257DA4|nr:dihydropyrimidinase [uncultured Roseobacter sp.]